jgi:hypothetical protein
MSESGEILGSHVSEYEEVWYKFTDVSKLPVASIIRVINSIITSFKN